MTSPAELIANNLAALPHPDGTPRQLAGFSTQLLPEAMHDEINKAAREIGESIINLLTEHGYHIVTDDELHQPTPTSSPEIAHVHCTLCDTRLFSLNITTPSHCLTNAESFIEAISQRSPGCPHQ